MFRIPKEKVVTVPVAINVPQDDGKYKAHKVNVTYQILPQTEVEAMQEASASGDGEQDLLKRVVRNVEPLEDESGSPLTWSPEVRDALLNWPYVRAALFKRYLEVSVGGEGRVKN